jgi:hypothetical protein
MVAVVGNDHQEVMRRWPRLGARKMHVGQEEDSFGPLCKTRRL